MELTKVNEQLKTLKEKNPDVFNALPDFIKEDIEITGDSIKSFIETDIGKSWLSSKTDSEISKGVDSYKEKNFNIAVDKKAKELADEKYKEMNPEETEDQKRIRDLEENIKKSDKDAKSSRLKNIAMGLLSEKKHSDFNHLIPNFIGSDEEETKSNVEKFIAGVDTYGTNLVTATTEQLAKKFGRNPEDLNNSGGGDGGGDGQENYGFDYGDE